MGYKRKFGWGMSVAFLGFISGITTQSSRAASIASPSTPDQSTTLPGARADALAVSTGQTSGISPEKENAAWAFTKRNFGLNYNSFVYGPGLTTSATVPPDNSGYPSDSGLNLWNLVSVKWKFSERLALDLQFRNQFVFTNQVEFRHQGQRLGISGKLLKGDTWSLTGAVNSDVPIRALMGQLASDRTLLFNPGMFASFEYQPPASKWSFYMLLTPRVFFYRDRMALAPQDISSGQGLNGKREVTLAFNPSINYAITDKIGWRFGAQLEWSKMVGSTGLDRTYMPLETGFTFDIGPYLSIYPYLQVSTPLDNGLRQSQALASGQPALNWADSLALNVWVSGVLF